MIYLIAGVLVLRMTLFLLRQKTSATSLPKRQSWAEGSSQESWPSQAVQSSIGIPMTKEMLVEEETALQEELALLEHRITASGVFVPDKIPALLALLRQASQPLARVNTSVAYEGETNLTMAEKRALHLNTRMKYTAEYIGFFHPDTLAGFEPKRLLSDMHLAAFHEVRNRRELAKLRRSDLVQRVGVLACGDGRDCKEVRMLRKTFALHDAPALPLPGCDALYCRCLYTPIVDSVAD